MAIFLFCLLIYSFSNEKFGSFSIGAALKTPIIYNNENIEYEGVS